MSEVTRFPTIPQMLEMSDDELRSLDMYDDIHELRAEIAARPTPPACPPWCTKEPGHSYDTFPSHGENGGTEWTRWHSAKPSPAAKAYVSQMEVNENGVVRLLDEPKVSVWLEEGADLTADDAYKAGAELVNAAIKLREIQQGAA